MVRTIAIPLIATGALVSLLTVIHDIRRLRIGAIHPQAAPRRVPPEIHAVAALFTGGGAAMLAGWVALPVVAIGHGALVVGIRWLIDRFA